MNRLSRFAFLLVAVGLLTASFLTAQEAVEKLSDLIGIRASSGERELEDRGYEFVRTHKKGGSSYTYWRNTKNDHCISVRTEDGRYSAIVHAPQSDCEGHKTEKDSFEAGNEQFDTVCGVETGGKTHLYQCRLRNENCVSGGQCRTHLTLPDNELTITWHGGGEIDVKAPGMNSQKSKTSVKDGQTRFDFGGNTYFVYRQHDQAKRELAKLER